MQSIPKDSDGLLTDSFLINLTVSEVISLSANASKGLLTKALFINEVTN